MRQRHLAPLIDSHVHTDDPRLDSHRDSMLEDARTANIKAQIVPSISRKERPIAVGECGLDYSITEDDRLKQQQLFAAHLAMAREFNLPIIIHARKAVEDVINMIKASGHYRGVIHSYNGSQQQAKQLLDLGYRLGFGGAVTYPRASRLRAMVQSLPLDGILLETDAPDQPDAAHHGQLNQPAYLIDILHFISDIRPESAMDIAVQTTRNSVELFALDPKILDVNF